MVTFRWYKVCQPALSGSWLLYSARYLSTGLNSNLPDEGGRDETG